MKEEHDRLIFTVIEIGKQYAECETSKGEKIDLARYKLPMDAVSGCKMYQDDFGMYKLIKKSK